MRRKMDQNKAEEKEGKYNMKKVEKEGVLIQWAFIIIIFFISLNSLVCEKKKKIKQTTPGKSETGGEEKKG